MTVCVLWLFLIGLQCVIVVFPDHTRLLFITSVQGINASIFEVLQSFAGD